MHRCLASLYYFKRIGNDLRKIRTDITQHRTPFNGSSAPYFSFLRCIRVLLADKAASVYFNFTPSSVGYSFRISLVPRSWNLTGA